VVVVAVVVWFCGGFLGVRDFYVFGGFVLELFVDVVFGGSVCYGFFL